jgi:hypothetical protein
LRFALCLPLHGKNFRVEPTYSSHDPRHRRTPPAFRRRQNPFLRSAPAIKAAQKNWSARLRTNFGRAAALPPGNHLRARRPGGRRRRSWRDVPMQKTADGWQIELPLAEVGYFKAKAYLLDEKNWQHWPDGSDVGISVHPNFARTANTIYCAFTRLFGATKNLASTPTKNWTRNSSHSKPSATRRCRRRENFATSPASCRTSSKPTRLPHHPSAAGASDAHDLRALRPFRQSVCRAGFDRR